MSVSGPRRGALRSGSASVSGERGATKRTGRRSLLPLSPPRPRPHLRRLRCRMTMATMMEVTMRATTPENRRPTAISRITGDVRVRILASYILLLLVAAIISVLAVRQVLLVRLDDRIEEA